MTEWRDIPGWAGLYQASDDGQIRSLDRVVRTKARYLMPKLGVVMTPQVDKHGYRRINLCRNRKYVGQFVHRLVALAFLGEAPFEGALVCHSDGTKTNNHVDNLRWGTISDNQRDAVRHGQHGQAKKTHCPRNHPYNEQNTYIWNRPDGYVGRACRICNREAVARSKRARQERAAAS